MNECTEENCKNGGQCIDEVGGYSCNCTKGYTGVNCEAGMISMIREAMLSVNSNLENGI